MFSIYFVHVRLNPKVGGPFMSEVIDEIVTILTEPRYVNKMVVVMAGYEKELDQLMKVNPGLKGRFSEKIHFTNFSCSDACKLLVMQLESAGLEVPKASKAAMPEMMDEVK